MCENGHVEMKSEADKRLWGVGECVVLMKLEVIWKNGLTRMILEVGL